LIGFGLAICTVGAQNVRERLYMRKIVVANQKGGCAKSTTVVNLAACLAELGYKCLVVDLDPQGNCSHWLGVENSSKGALQLFINKPVINNLIVNSSIDLVSCIPASQELSRIEMYLSSHDQTETILKKHFDQLNFQNIDFLIVDTPPTLGIITINALVACTELLVPVTTHVLTLSGVSQLIDKVETLQETHNPHLKVLGFLPSRVNLRTKHSQEIIDILKNRFKNNVFNTNIKENIRLAEAPSFQESILDYDPKGSSVEDFRSFTLEVLEKGLTHA